MDKMRLPGATSDEEEFLQLHKWSELPELVLYSVLRRLRSFPDFLSFSSVCRSWRSFSSSSSSKGCFPPLLLSPSFRALTLRSVLENPAGAALRSFQSKVPPETLTLPFLGYSNGHLLFHSPATSHLLLANVFTGGVARVPSPPDHSLCSGGGGGGGGFRVALLAADSLVLASNSLVLHYRSATRSWRQLHHGAASLAVFQNKIFCVDPARKRLTVIPTAAGPGAAAETEVTIQLPVLSGPLILCRDLGYRLAAAGPDLLLLRLAFRFSVPQFYPVSRTVDVFRLDAGRAAWEEVEALGDWCVFVDAAAGCATACAEPGRWGGRSGCVYVTGPGCDGWAAVPVADGGDRRFELNGNGARDLNMSPPRWPSPVWVHPTTQPLTTTSFLF